MAGSLRRRMTTAVFIFAAVFTGFSAFAQTGGVTGKCIGSGGTPLVGHTVQIERVDIKWTGKTKTNKKGEYTYIGLAPGDYKVTLLDPSGKPLDVQNKRVGIGDPTEINFNIEQAMKEQQKEREADPQYQKQVEAQKQSNSLKQMFDQGRELYAQQRYTDAAAAFEKAVPLAKDKNIPIVLSQLGDTWQKAAAAETNPDVRKADQEKALDYFNKVLAILPNDASVHDRIAHLYGDMGRSADAEAEFKKAADLDPTHASGYYYNLGAILVNKGQMDQAAVELKKATDLDATNANAWYWYGTALMGKAGVKPDGTIDPVPGTIEAFQNYLKLAPTGKWAGPAQDSLNALQSKADLEYKKKKK